jgi:hypothetical protein
MDRYKPSAAKQSELLEEWNNRCAYCELPFGTLVWRRGIGREDKTRKGYRPNFGYLTVQLEWDHFVPFAYTDSCADGQFLPACQLCNGLKSDSMFRTIEGARESLEPHWVRKYEMATGPVLTWEAAHLADA